FPPEDALRLIYSNAAAFVYPSYGEGFGIPVLEAMACGTLPLLADLPVFREVAGDAAWFFDPFDPEAMAAAMDRALARPSRPGAVRRGYDQVAKYSWDRCAQETFEVYCRAAAQGAS